VNSHLHSGFVVLALAGIRPAKARTTEQDKTTPKIPRLTAV
jgi:hypothetical protein